MTEVGGDGAVYFDLLDDGGAAKTILEALSRKDVWEKQGLKKAVKYSADSMISVCLDTYRKVVH